MVAAAVAGLGLGAVALGGAVTSAQEGDGPVGSLLARVAEKLGISEEELSDAFTEARIDMVDEAVEEGSLTEEEAAEIRERIEAGEGRFPGPQHRPRPEVCQRAGHFVIDAAVEVLGVEKGQLVSELAQDKTLAQVAEEQGMTVEEFTEALLEQVRVDLDELVADGTLTQEKADAVFERFEENVDRIVNGDIGPGDRPCRPHGGGHGGPGGPGGGGPFGPEAEPSGLTI
jgi:uncharacterized protein YidB (DUF937 family)